MENRPFLNDERFKIKAEETLNPIFERILVKSSPRKWFRVQRDLRKFRDGYKIIHISHSTGRKRLVNDLSKTAQQLGFADGDKLILFFYMTLSDRIPYSTKEEQDLFSDLQSSMKFEVEVVLSHSREFVDLETETDRKVTDLKADICKRFGLVPDDHLVQVVLSIPVKLKGKGREGRFKYPKTLEDNETLAQQEITESSKLLLVRKVDPMECSSYQHNILLT